MVGVPPEYGGGWLCGEELATLASQLRSSPPRGVRCSTGERVPPDDELGTGCESPGRPSGANVDFLAAASSCTTLKMACTGSILPLVLERRSARPMVAWNAVSSVAVDMKLATLCRRLPRTERGVASVLSNAGGFVDWPRTSRRGPASGWRVLGSAGGCESHVSGAISTMLSERFIGVLRPETEYVPQSQAPSTGTGIRGVTSGAELLPSERVETMLALRSCRPAGPPEPVENVRGKDDRRG